MRNLVVTLPQVAFIAGTRAALGVGVGLLLSQRIDLPRRRQIGWGLFALGAATTIPALRSLLRQREGTTGPAASVA